MDSLARYNKLVGQYGEDADFLVVYISEAHPTDGWLIPGTVEIANHKSLQDRFAAARQMVELEPPPCPVLVDDMSNQGNELYSALPERLFVLLDGKIVYHGGMGPFHHKVEEVEDWLANWTKSS